MLEKIKHNLEKRKILLQDIFLLALDAKRLFEENEKLDDEFLNGKIDSLQYAKRKERLNQVDWKNEYSSNLFSSITSLEEIDKEILKDVQNLDQSFQNISYSYKTKFAQIKSFFKSQKEEIEKLKKEKENYFNLKAQNQVYDQQEINEEILLKYDTLLKKYAKKIENIKPLEIKDIKWNGNTDEIFYLNEEEIKKLPFFLKIKYWYYKKFILPNLIQQKNEKIKAKKEDYQFSSESVEGMHSLLEIVKFGQEKKKKEKAEEENKTYLLDEEITALQKILKQKELKNDEEFKLPIWLMFIINLFSSNISLFLIKQFPEYFEELYKKIQVANLKILPSIYINVLIFTSLFLGLFFFIIGLIMGILFFKLPFMIAFAFSWFLAIITIILIVIVFTEYPNSIIKERKKSIETNLPFAIIHMSSIAGSGVVPLKMFELIAERKDFGAVSEEFARIVKYVNLFGVDLITAIRETVELTPSQQLREFLNGLITSIESGGDLILYLTIKANEILDLYRINREKVNDNISVFSEMYMGVLITAPIFFVLIISIIGFLGATFSGISAPVMLGIFTYIIFPLLNFMFYIILDNILIGY
ncbi:MAG: type II secretion system F family protein [Candidatus Woesearchaeota archaeon]